MTEPNTPLAHSFSGADLTHELLFKVADATAWTLNTGATWSEIDDLAKRLIDGWKSRKERNAAFNWALTLDDAVAVKADTRRTEALPEAKRRELRREMTARDTRIVFKWAGAVEAAVVRVVVEGTPPMTAQTAEALAESVAVTARWLRTGEFRLSAASQHALALSAVASTVSPSAAAAWASWWRDCLWSGPRSDTWRQWTWQFWNSPLAQDIARRCDEVYSEWERVRRVDLAAEAEQQEAERRWAAAQTPMVDRHTSLLCTYNRAAPLASLGVA